MTGGQAQGGRGGVSVIGPARGPVGPGMQPTGTMGTQGGGAGGQMGAGPGRQGGASVIGPARGPVGPGMQPTGTMGTMGGGAGRMPSSPTAGRMPTGQGMAPAGGGFGGGVRGGLAGMTQQPQGQQTSLTQPGQGMGQQQGQAQMSQGAQMGQGQTAQAGGQQMQGGQAQPYVNPALGSVQTGPDGRQTVQLNEQGRASYQRAYDATKRNYGRWPGMENPSAPQPRIMPGEPNFNPFNPNGWID